MQVYVKFATYATYTCCLYH